jgi:hypothetical protein
MEIKQSWNSDADGGKNQRTVEFSADTNDVTLFARVVVPYIPNIPLTAVYLNAQMALLAAFHDFAEALNSNDLVMVERSETGIIYRDNIYDEEAALIIEFLAKRHGGEVLDRVIDKILSEGDKLEFPDLVEARE